MAKHRIVFILIIICFPASVKAQMQGTWKKFKTTTETFETFMRNNPMGNKYDNSMSLIKNVNVRSEAEATLVSDSSGISLTYTERTIFESSGFNTPIFRIAWGPMQSRYPIEMWKELRERTNDKIREWIKGDDNFDIAKKYNIGKGGAINATPNSNNRSFVMTITLPLDNANFELMDNGSLKADISFHKLISDIMKTSKLFRADAFIMTKQ